MGESIADIKMSLEETVGGREATAGSKKGWKRIVIANEGLLGVYS